MGAWGYPASSAIYKLKNNLVQSGSGNYWFDFGGNVATEYIANLSSDGTSPNVALRNKIVNFASESNDDFHLNSTDTGAKNFGADLSGDANLPFNTDVDGQSRVGSWDIGADERPSNTVIKGGVRIIK